MPDSTGEQAASSEARDGGRDDAAVRAEGHYGIAWALWIANEAVKLGRGVTMSVDVYDGAELPCRVRLNVQIDPKTPRDGGPG